VAAGEGDEPVPLDRDFPATAFWVRFCLQQADRILAVTAAGPVPQVDNLPVKAMADMREGPVIAVDVKATFERPEPGPAGAPDRPLRLPSLNETLMRVVLLGSENTSEAAQRHADLVIRPRAQGIGLLEFHQLDTAREAGRMATLQEAFLRLHTVAVPVGPVKEVIATAPFISSWNDTSPSLKLDCR